MSSIRILLVDDHVLVRAGFRALLGRVTDFEVVAEASDGQEAVVLAARLEPAVVLMDLTMPTLGGLEATARIVTRHPEVRVLVVSMHTSEEMVLPVLRAGASGYLVKAAALVELEIGVRAVARGETYLSPAISALVVAARSGTERPLSSFERLTSRQREVLQLVAEGRTSKEVASALGISVRTAEAHRAQLMELLGTRHVAGLVRVALRAGLISD